MDEGSTYTYTYTYTSTGVPSEGTFITDKRVEQLD